MQVGTRVWAAGSWRALDTAAMFKQQGAIRALGAAVIAASPELAAVLDRHGLTLNPAQLAFTPFGPEVLLEPDHPEAERFLAFLNRWTQLTMLLNGMSRAMGQPDFYPFVMPHEVVAKLHFIHLLVAETAQTQASVSP